MEKNTYNHDRFNTWEKCRKRYYFKYIKELKWPELNDNYKLGQSVHALIDYQLRGLKIDHLLKNIDEDITPHWKAIQSHPIIKNDVIATEWAFNSRIGDSKCWINGRIDAIFYDGQKYIIADWKTGQNIPENPDTDFQSMLYLYAFFNGHKDLGLDLKQEDIVFQYIKTPKLDNPAPIIYSAEKEYEGIFLNKIQEIEETKIFDKANPCPLKKYCQYKKLCLSD
ncbi:MAG: hypothetical protein ACD_20C00107G0007 [uncultured bacterium]|nr:MAG: hypothetical protein ACD_20C00107G0007 [uncultured bacterium]HBH19186.1 hypothetical protein [Cyanobacteria bacterium UBA9579]